ncbi:hypothetical protein GUJ93_ZPchr0008g13581 [Zizania palustris]|uniref:Uncharacterized protein n=1 Tax=Zizania palustris TaxID=103762 RepID=A0A8J5V5E0_ZIZPA|nr:hypothetical protein GUJ93_ZPchr0008g13581 [Zizania palustris]
MQCDPSTGRLSRSMVTATLAAAAPLQSTLHALPSIRSCIFLPFRSIPPPHRPNRKQILSQMERLPSPIASSRCCRRA